MNLPQNVSPCLQREFEFVDILSTIRKTDRLKEKFICPGVIHSETPHGETSFIFSSFYRKHFCFFYVQAAFVVDEHKSTADVQIVTKEQVFLKFMLYLLTVT